MPLAPAIKNKLRELPNKPGCYIMRDRWGQIIYVGKAAKLRQRVRSYFQKATRQRADAKLRGLIDSVAELETIVLRSVSAAALTESRLIKDYRPRYNQLLKDDKRFPLLRVDLKQPFPRFQLCRLRRPDGAQYFGPYAQSGAVRLTLDFIEKRFGLRKCTAPIPNAATHQHCLNDIVRFCAAPCIGKTTPAAYRRQVQEACAFLRGQRPAILKEVEAAMQAAAQALDFEKAAASRDTLQSLRAALREEARDVRPRPSRREQGLQGAQALRAVLQLPHPPRLIEAYDVSNISGTLAVGSLVVACNGMPRATLYRRFRIKTATARDDAEMLAEIIQRRFSRLRQEKGAAPDLVLVDGGAIQLRAAQQALQALGYSTIPVAGLAKRQEEIFWPSDKGLRVLRLARGTPALKLLQMLRDEAHRFALTYHRQLRAQRIRESLLDDIPGIGRQRKAQLLKHFGSLTRLAQAPLKEIAARPGIGPHLAQAIKLALQQQAR